MKVEKFKPSKAFTKIRRKLSKLIYEADKFENHFNVPIKFGPQGIRAVNERIIEVPFVLSHVQGEKLKILDFGCTRSWISLSLASSGHKVYGVDLRDYNFKHKNFTFHKGDILNFDQRDFDIVICLSTLEHIGLGAYGEDYNPQVLRDVIQKIYKILKATGVLILTLPVGVSSVDDFERSFAPEEIIELITQANFELKKERYFYRRNGKEWLACFKEVIKKIHNDFESRREYGSGVNGIGCF
ncbi:class I SAM-dependent methyltransferase, partial [Planctomycetota bacterium]